MITVLLNLVSVSICHVINIVSIGINVRHLLFGNNLGVRINKFMGFKNWIISLPVF